MLHEKLNNEFESEFLIKFGMVLQNEPPSSPLSPGAPCGPGGHRLGR